MDRKEFKKWSDRIQEASHNLSTMKEIIDELEAMGLDKIKASWVYINDDPQDLHGVNLSLYLLGAAYAIYDELMFMNEL